jgi:predicted phosphodiesterase
MIYVTGDTHIPIDIQKLNTSNFPEQKNLTKDDYVIILGDFGLIWKSIGDRQEKYWRNWLNEKTFTTLFVDGNHENFTRLNNYPITKWEGGNIHKISDSIFHLMRGEIFNIEDELFHVMGGGFSIDKHRRKENISWWKEEMINLDEWNNGINNLKKYNNKVDYILSHSAGYLEIESKLFPDSIPNTVTNYLDYIYSFVEFKKNYCGHYHVDEQLSDRVIGLYDNLIKLK